MDTCPKLNKTLDGDDVCDSTLLARSFEKSCTFKFDFSTTKSTKSNNLEKTLDLDKENKSQMGPLKLKTERSKDLFSHIITDIDPLAIGSISDSTFNVGDVILDINGTMVTDFQHLEIMDHFNTIIQEIMYSKNTELVILIKRMTKFIEYTFKSELETDLCEDGLYDDCIEKLFGKGKLTRKEPLQYIHPSSDPNMIGTNADFIRYGLTCRQLIMGKIDTDTNPEFVFIKHQFYIVSDDVFICALQSKTTGDYIYCKDNCYNICCKQMEPIKTIHNYLIVPDKRFFVFSEHGDDIYLESFIHRGYYITYNKVDNFKLKKAKEPWSADYAVKHKASQFQFKMIVAGL